MHLDILVKGYRQIIDTIYSPKYYYARLKNFLKDFRPIDLGKINIGFKGLKAFIKANIRLGLFGKERFYYWKLVFWSLFRCTESFAPAITMAIYGYHFRKGIKRIYYSLRPETGAG